MHIRIPRNPREEYYLLCNPYNKPAAKPFYPDYLSSNFVPQYQATILQELIHQRKDTAQSLYRGHELSEASD